jgi:dTDP-4-dehydrorhamnose 3,5-epimerase
MGIVSLEDIIVTPLKRIPTIGGDVMHGLKKSDNGFNGFGEVYFSWIEQGAIKAWKCHQYTTLNLIVPLGEVRFVFFIKEFVADRKEKFRIEKIGDNRYSRLTVPPGIWFGFQGLTPGCNLLMNIIDIEHDPDEVLRLSLSDINYVWN